LFNRLGLRSEIVLQLSLLMAAAIVFVSLLIMRVSEQELLQQRIQQGTSIVKAITVNLNLKTSGSHDIENYLQKVLGQIHPSVGIKAIAVIDSRQTHQSSTGEITNWLDEKESTFAQLSHSMSTKLRYRGFLQTLFAPSNNYLLVTLPTQNNDNKSQIIQAYFSLNDIHSLAYQARNYLIPYIFLVGLTLTLFGSYLLGKIVVEPVRSLQQASKNIALGNLEQSVPTSGPKEIHQLADHFNRMSQALHSSRKETENQIRNLEQVNQELRKTREALGRAEKMASIGHLAAGMAHEIGNPLGALIGYLNFLRGQLMTGNPELSQDVLNRSLKEADRIDLLVHDLLDYARPKEGASPSCEPTQAIRETIQLLNQQNTLDSSRLALHLPEQLPHIKLAQHKLQQVIINLLINARDASPTDEIIALSVTEKKNLVEVIISDSGEGIPPSDLPHIFDPFYTTKPHGKGRGLGLFISHRIVSDAGGTIEVESVPEHGTHFKLLIPTTESSTNEN